jgi:hypothetical protein
VEKLGFLPLIFAGFGFFDDLISLHSGGRDYAAI